MEEERSGSRWSRKRRGEAGGGREEETGKRRGEVDLKYGKEGCRGGQKVEGRKRGGGRRGKEEKRSRGGKHQERRRDKVWVEERGEKRSERGNEERTGVCVRKRGAQEETRTGAHRLRRGSEGEEGPDRKCVEVRGQLLSQEWLLI